MADVAHYRQLVQELLQGYSNIKANNEAVEAEAIFDPQRDRYQLVHVGWSNKRRVYGCVLHLDIKDGKIWIQHNMTEADIGQELVEKGVPASDIILGLHFKYNFLISSFSNQTHQ